MTLAQMRFVKLLAAFFMTWVILFNPVPKSFLLPIIFIGFYKSFDVIPKD